MLELKLIHVKRVPGDAWTSAYNIPVCGGDFLMWNLQVSIDGSAQDYHTGV